MKYTEQVLLEIYKSQHERFHQARNNQWKMNVTFWTLIVLAIYNYEKFTINCFSVVICVTLFILHLMFTIALQQNLQTDKRIWCDILNYWNNGFTEENEFKIETKSATVADLKLRAWFWIIFQLSISFILFLIFLTRLA